MKNLAALLALLLLTACTGAGMAASKETPPGSDPADEAAQRGRILFRDKGCVSCHVNQRIEGQTGVLGAIGPDLTGYTREAEFLRSWLKDPASIRPETKMPNLRLMASEIEDLIAFLNEPQ